MGTVEPATGHQNVGMRGKILIPTKGRDDRHNARQIVFGSVPVFERLMRNGKEHVVVSSLAKLKIPPKLRGRMEDNVFVSCVGKQEIEFFLPAFGLGDAARGTEAGFAGKEHPFLIPAFGALIMTKSHCLGAAGKHFGDVFGDCRTFEKLPVFFRDVWPVVGEDAF